jgi:intergrase/recombinase
MKMAYKFNHDPNAPVDASLGLIFRLNGLWQRMDESAYNGDFVKWNAMLDRIFCNLLYKNSLDIVQDEKTGKIVDVKLDEEDQRTFDYLNNKYLSALETYRKARTKESLHNAKEELYAALMMKDVGLRKFMFKLKLYLKESDRNPARSMFG